MKIKQDMHIHTHLSSCSRDPEQNPKAIIEWAAQNGLDTICFTDHFWDETIPGASDWYKPQDLQHIEAIREQIPLSTLGVKVLVGCETEFIGGKTVGISRAVADKMDFINLPFDHFHMKDFVCPHTIKTVEQVAELWLIRFDEVLELDLPWHKIALAHCNDILGFKPQMKAIFEILLNDNKRELQRLFIRCATQGTKIEINTSVCSSPVWQDLFSYHKAFFSIAKDSGCLFTFGSDAHHPKALNNILPASSVAKRLGLEKHHIYQPL